MKKEKDMFKNIIGYDDVKKSLTRLIDVLNNKDKYERIGSSIPHGLLLYGPPGTGKTSMAGIILSNVKNRKVFVIRKIKSDGDFIDYMKKEFDSAIKEQPSIILLDDLDKFSEANKYVSNQEEYVAVQSFLDNNKKEDVFVIATCNDKDELPDSLLRSGRFDIHIEVDNPSDDDSLIIIKHYLKKKKIDKELDVNKVSKILIGSTCADLEKVCNNAGIYAAYDNKESIGMDDLIRASIEHKYDTRIEDIYKEDKYSLDTSYHEAGHALIGTLLEPGSISCVTSIKNEGDVGGLTIFHKNKDYYYDIKYRINRIKTLLAGKAATDIIYNKCDIGSYNDLDRAYKIARDLVDNYCINNFSSKTFYKESSNDTLYNKDKESNELINRCYNEVKSMLIANRFTLDALAYELNKRKILFDTEIETIINNDTDFNNKKVIVNG